MHRLDDLGHAEGLAAAGYAQQGLAALPVVKALHQLGNGLGLVALGPHVADNLES